MNIWPSLNQHVVVIRGAISIDLCARPRPAPPLPEPRPGSLGGTRARWLRRRRRRTD